MGLNWQDATTNRRTTYVSVERDASCEPIQCVTGNIQSEQRGLGFPTVGDQSQLTSYSQIT